MDLPINSMVMFHSFLYVYQRVWGDMIYANEWVDSNKHHWESHFVESDCWLVVNSLLDHLIHVGGTLVDLSLVGDHF